MDFEDGTSTLQESLNRLLQHLLIVCEDCRAQLAKTSAICSSKKIVFQQPSNEALALLAREDPVIDEVTSDEAVISRTDLEEIENLLEKAKIAAHKWENTSRKSSLPANYLKRDFASVRLPPLRRVSTATTERDINKQKPPVKQTAAWKEEVLKLPKKTKLVNVTKSVAYQSKSRSTESSSRNSSTSRRTQSSASSTTASEINTGAISKRDATIPLQRENSTTTPLLLMDSAFDEQRSAHMQRKEQLKTALHLHYVGISRGKNLSTVPTSKYKKIFIQKVESTEADVCRLSSEDQETASKYKLLFQKMRRVASNDITKEITSSTVRFKHTFQKLEERYKGIADDGTITKHTMSSINLFDSTATPRWLWYRNGTFQCANLSRKAGYVNFSELLRYTTLLHEIQWYQFQEYLHKVVIESILPGLLKMDPSDSSILPIFKCIYSLLCEDGSKYPILLKTST